MNEYEYNGYVITENYDGYYVVGEYEFPSLDEAMDWIDDLNPVDDVQGISEPTLHTYHIFFVDDGTDRSFDAYEEAYSYEEAERKLRRDYDVYHIIDWDIVE